MNRTYYWKMVPEDVYSKYLEIGERLIEKNSDSAEKPTKMRVYQHEMFVKYVYHLASILTLEKGSLFSKTDYSKKAYDYSSVTVLFRAALETFLSYYYIYHDSSDEDEIKFRYHNWLIDGLGFRQSMNVTFSPELEEKKRKEKLEIRASVEIIKGTKAFQKLSEGQKRLVIQKHQWIRPGWSEIIVRTGIAEYWSKMFYAQFSAYAHTSSQSIMQFKDATIRREGKQLSSAFASLIFMATSLFIGCYMKDFNIREVLSEAQQEMLEAWEWMSKNLPKA